MEKERFYHREDPLPPRVRHREEMHPPYRFNHSGTSVYNHPIYALGIIGKRNDYMTS